MDRRETSKNRIKFFIIIILLPFVFASCSNEKVQDKLVVINGMTMGTTYTVKLVKGFKSAVAGKKVDYYLLKKGITQVLKQINQQMSIFTNDSEISQFNRFRGSDWFRTSLDIGYKNISVRLSPPAVKKRIKEIYCDLSAIAKGFGVDRLAEYLDSEKISSYLIEIGGEVRARGKNNYNKWWRIGIASPTNTFGIQKVIDLKNRSMATSGDYRNYFEKDGIRYSHTINPKTGRPISHNLASVTVIDDSCLIADALATAINVLGPDKGYDFALKEDLAVFFVQKADNGFIEKSTPKFEKILDSRGDQN